MGNLQQTLDALQPYVIGIRYVDKQPVVDAVFKDGWSVPDSDIITKIKGNEELNYYMIYSDNAGVGLDELLGYVDLTIKVNIEREKKHELLKDKVNELKELFKKNSLTKLRLLKFSFTEQDMIPEIGEFELNEIKEHLVDNTVVNDIPNSESVNTNEIVAASEEEKEILEEELRAENFKRIQENKKKNGQLRNLSNTIELPPKKTIESFNEDCDCGPEEACEKCIDRKGF